MKALLGLFSLIAFAIGNLAQAQIITAAAAGHQIADNRA
jgi:hypothetical protein